MSTFPISNDDYSVEEITYEDMMSIIASQKPTLSDLPSNGEVEITPEVAKNSLKKPASKDDDFSQRIAKNANRQLPDWLLNS
ncbi:MAG: hypothetical protein KZQ70_11095 [gamma proteobacterium symbiont of Lucinoma myriamae]|nr:hypothetical protein [gamma proteobacterium symbiont of Lucinoma myriamae]MCU7818709.1 hypothetical protein [gamma proteobacterium symbiont of Lucinoma myriamae]MCU7832980.1 hypothetical protein [gamma proteobacterium symbiont of Lucinoma myriamae]